MEQWQNQAEPQLPISFFLDAARAWVERSSLPFLLAVEPTPFALLRFARLMFEIQSTKMVSWL